MTLSSLFHWFSVLSSSLLYLLSSRYSPMCSCSVIGALSLCVSFSTMYISILILKALCINCFDWCWFWVLSTNTPLLLLSMTMHDEHMVQLPYILLLTNIELFKYSPYLSIPESCNNPYGLLTFDSRIVLIADLANVLSFDPMNSMIYLIAYFY